MADITYINNNSPTSRTEVTFSTSRSGATVYINATVSVTLLYSSGYFNYDGEINFNMWSSGASASANIKSYSDRWTVNSPRTRTRTCSMAITNIYNTVQVGCNVTVPSGHVSIAMPDQYVWIGVPSFDAPSAPTWANINPNPCNINAAPLITWGGARPGSLGSLFYDVEVRSTLASGGWTNWLRIATSQSPTSYQEIALKNMYVNGQRPYVGVKYQYRIRSSDNSYSTSNWISTPELSVSFGNPTPPTSYTFSDISIKKDGTEVITWAGASGGTGNISSYEVDYRIYNHTTSKWSSWIQGYSGSNTSYVFDLSKLYNINENIYYIGSSKDQNYLINVENNSLENDAKINIWRRTGEKNQQCKITYTEDGFYKITFENSQKCLDVPGGKPSQGVQLQQYTDNNTDAQKWLIIKNDDGTYTFIPKTGFNYGLDIKNNALTDGNPIQLYTKNYSQAQKFILQAVDGEKIEKPLLSNGDLIQFRIRTKNSYDQYSDYLNTNTITVRGNQMWLKIEGLWIEGETYFKINGVWYSVTPYLKINGVWYETT